MNYDDNGWNKSVIAEFNGGTPLVIEECVRGFEVFPFKGANTVIADAVKFDTLTDVLAWAVDMSHDSFKVEYVRGSLFITKKSLNDTVENLKEALDRSNLANEDLAKKLRYFKECNENQYLLIRALKKETL